MSVHIIRQAFGIKSIEHLRRVLAGRERVRTDGGRAVVVTTRNRPRRAAEAVDGGSLYWIVGRQILARQRFLAIEDAAPPEQPDGQPDAPGRKPRCAFVLDPALVLTVPRPRRAQQGWRYLEPGDAPPDLETGEYGEQSASPELRAGLRELGLIYDEGGEG